MSHIIYLKFKYVNEVPLPHTMFSFLLFFLFLKRQTFFISTLWFAEIMEVQIWNSKHYFFLIRALMSILKRHDNIQLNLLQHYGQNVHSFPKQRSALKAFHTE